MKEPVIEADRRNLNRVVACRNRRRRLGYRDLRLLIAEYGEQTKPFDLHFVKLL